MEREAVYVRMCTEAGVRAYRELQKALEDPDSWVKSYKEFPIYSGFQSSLISVLTEIKGKHIH